MAENADPLSNFDPNIQSEDIAFKPGEMNACTGCSRSNPPNRVDCLYCGKPLDLPVEKAVDLKLSHQPLESWQLGWNIIASGNGKPDDRATMQIASMLMLDESEISGVLGTSVPIPITRVETQQKAEILAARLRSLSVECQIVSDALLDAETPPVRLKHIDFGEGTINLRDFNTGEVKDLDAAEIVLVVVGQLVTSRTDVLEKRRRKGPADIIDASATGSDETVIDLYARGEANGFRIRTTGFDFSGLGEQMSVLASENLRVLIERLKAALPYALVNESYGSIRPLLESSWPTETRNDTLGVHRTGFGKRGFGSIASTNNFLQFTKFSRLQYHIRTE